MIVLRQLRGLLDLLQGAYAGAAFEVADADLLQRAPLLPDSPHPALLETLLAAPAQGPPLPAAEL